MAKTRNLSPTKKKASQSKKVRPIVWALDPFSELKSESAKIFAFLKTWAHSPLEEIEATYVLSPDGLNWTGTFSPPWVSRLKPYVEEAFKELPFAVRTNILVSPRVSLKGDVQKLFEHAKKKNARFVVLHTHGRKGVERFFLGSFSETALNSAKVPVLLINPEAAIPPRIEKVLFPVDLSPQSKTAAKKLAQLIAPLHAKVVVYHKMPDPIEPIVQSGVYMAGGGWINLEQYRSKDFAKRSQGCQEVVGLFKKAGLEAEFVVDEKPGLVVERIREACEKSNCQMVALLTQSGAWERWLLGSVTRDLAREIKHPLLVFPK